MYTSSVKGREAPVDFESRLDWVFGSWSYSLIAKGMPGVTDFRVDPSHIIARNTRGSSTSSPANLRTSSPYRAGKTTPKFEIKGFAAPRGRAGKSILSAANRYLGTPYEMGGGRNAGPVRSIDCSAFVARAYADATNGRVKLTPYTDAMYDETVPISASEAQPGDLVFYKGHDPSQQNTRFPHVAIYAGNGQVVDASSMVGRVAYHPISIGNKYSREFRRVKMPEDQPGM
ncbi:MAG: C40 family peptidase [Dehalococcoidales bacterium]|nr:C40 family peptidase [Dehalococcoidales bacterium]